MTDDQVPGGQLLLASDRCGNHCCEMKHLVVKLIKVVPVYDIPRFLTSYKANSTKTESGTINSITRIYRPRPVRIGFTSDLL